MDRIQRIATVVLCVALCLSGCVAQQMNLRNSESHAQAGYAAESRGDWDQARRQFAQAVVNADLGGATPLEKATVNYEYGRASGVVCHWDYAETYLLRARQFSIDGGRKPTLEVLELAYVSERKGELDSAAHYYAELMPLIDQEDLRTRYPLGVADIYDRYSKVLAATGDVTQAEAKRVEAQSIRREHPDARQFGSVTPYGTTCSSSSQEEKDVSMPEALTSKSRALPRQR